MTRTQVISTASRSVASLNFERFEMCAKYNLWSKHFSKKPEAIMSRIFQNHIEAAKKLYLTDKPIQAARHLSTALKKYHAKDRAPIPGDARGTICKVTVALMNKHEFHRANELCLLMLEKGGSEDAKASVKIGLRINQQAGNYYSNLTDYYLGRLELGMSYAKKAADNAMYFNPALKDGLCKKLANGYFELAKKEHESGYTYGLDLNIGKAIFNNPNREQEFRAFRADMHFRDFKNERFLFDAEILIRAAIAWDSSREQFFKTAMADKYLSVALRDFIFSDAKAHLEQAIAWDPGRKNEFMSAVEKKFSVLPAARQKA